MISFFFAIQMQLQQLNVKRKNTLFKAVRQLVYKIEYNDNDNVYIVGARRRLK